MNNLSQYFTAGNQSLPVSYLIGILIFITIIPTIITVIIHQKNQRTSVFHMILPIIVIDLIVGTAIFLGCIQIQTGENIQISKPATNLNLQVDQVSENTAVAKSAIPLQNLNYVPTTNVLLTKTTPAIKPEQQPLIRTYTGHPVILGQLVFNKESKPSIQNVTTSGKLFEKGLNQALNEVHKNYPKLNSQQQLNKLTLVKSHENKRQLIDVQFSYVNRQQETHMVIASQTKPIKQNANTTYVIG